MWQAGVEIGRGLAHAGFTAITGGGPGIMEAVNKGAAQAGGVSVGLGIELPFEQALNKHVTLGINFRYFFARKVMFVKYSQGFIVMPGGFGTFDELFESLTLVQTGKVTSFPVVLMGGGNLGLSTGGRTIVYPGVETGGTAHRQISNLWATLGKLAGATPTQVGKTQVDFDMFGKEGPGRITPGPLSELMK